VCLCVCHTGERCKRTVLGRNHVIWAINRENRSRGSSWACEREKGQDRTGKKSQKGYISHICGEAPTEAMHMKICFVGDVLDVITCAKFQNEIFRGYDFTGGRIFHFPIDFWMGLTTVQRYCAACGYYYYYYYITSHLSTAGHYPHNVTLQVSNLDPTASFRRRNIWMKAGYQSRGVARPPRRVLIELLMCDESDSDWRALMWRTYNASEQSNSHVRYLSIVRRSTASPHSTTPL